jgi:hypothetical protein
MPTSSSTVRISGLTTTEASRVIARLHFMQKIGVLSKDIEIERGHREDTKGGLAVERARYFHEFTGL